MASSVGGYGVVAASASRASSESAVSGESNACVGGGEIILLSTCLTSVGRRVSLAICDVGGGDGAVVSGSVEERLVAQTASI